MLARGNKGKRTEVLYVRVTKTARKLATKNVRAKRYISLSEYITDLILKDQK